MKRLVKNTVFSVGIKIILLAAVLLFTYLMVQISIPYLLPPFPTYIDFLITKQDVLHIDAWRWAFYLHISTSFFVILAGLTQFSNTILKKHAKVHRQMGKAYVLIILLVSGPSGFLMAFYANGGIVGQVGFITLSVLWWGATFLAYRFILKKNLKAHGNWMLRSYALSLSAVTLRLVMFLAPFLIEATTYESTYTFAAWFSWSFNLAITEGFILLKGLQRFGNFYK